ncbi:MAG: hypothetical protein CMA14_01365 [Euryarchaeota archaeon]|nr:hypothetical protein [Euryarchaeota archaeon]OUW79269.1 MAG: hypothetical protein CBD75_01115 [Euryarchaeota archaeon TMED215]
MSFQAHDVTFREVITIHGANYFIPRFQRAYSWNTDNAEDFYGDMKEEQDEFFAGSIVLNNQKLSSEDKIEIIDGQQRMITSTILLAAIRDAFNDNELAGEAEEVQNEYIGKHSQRDHTTNYKLIPADQLRDWFLRHIQSFPRDEFPSTRNLNAEQKKVRDNYNHFQKEIRKEIDNLDTSAKRDRLYKILDRLQDMRLVKIEVSDEARAYEIFETVNARGADLTVADLLKNTIFREVPPDARRGGDFAKDMWAKILENLEGTGIDITTFVRYHWLSKKPFETKKNLYRKVKSEIIDWPTFLEDLHNDSEVINALNNSNIRDLDLNLNDRATKEVNRSLVGINAVGTTQSYVIFLALIRNYENSGINKIYKIFRTIEKFTFFYHGVCRGPANVVERFWNRKSRELLEIIDEPNERRKTAARNRWESDLRDYLNERMSESLFRERFEKNLTYKNSIKARGLIKYFLTSINREISPEGFDDSSVSIEHILPQTPTKWNLSKTQIKPYVNTIGNLTLIHPDMNGRMGNKTLKEKIPVLEESDIKLNVGVLNSIEYRMEEIEIQPDTTEEEGELITQQIEVPFWNDETIGKRTSNLCEKALEIWSL